MFWNVGGGRGLFIYTADEYPHAHIDSGIFSFNFSIISLGRVWFVGKKSSYVYIFLNLIKLLVLITNNQKNNRDRALQPTRYILDRL